jgi:ribonucleotide monophosphatase NagD (HAD superfamily)
MKNKINHFPPGYETDQSQIAIDFDGVIHTFDKGFHDGTCYGDPIEGSLEAIKQLAKKYKIVIFTAKAKPDRPLVNGKTGTQLVEEWLEKYEIKDCVSYITSEKPRAMLYIDDNGYRFENWTDTLKFVENKIW